MFPIKFGIWVDEIRVFLSEKRIVKLIFELLWSPKSATDFLSGQSRKTFAFFALFCFELAFGVNMKVLDNFVSFPMGLVWLENDF